MVKLTRKEAEYIVATGAAIDFLTEGKYTGKVSRLVKAAVRKGAPIIGRATARSAPRLAGTAFQVGRTIAMRHPYIAAAGLIYLGIKERERIGELASQGWEVVDDYASGVQERTYDPASYEPITSFSLKDKLMEPIDRIRDPFAVNLPFGKRKRKRSSYNRAVSSAMKAVKKSKFLGKPGKLSSPKKAFATVNRTVSRIKRGVKVAKKGVSAVISRAVRRIL
jgi:hypothetical protein